MKKNILTLKPGHLNLKQIFDIANKRTSIDVTKQTISNVQKTSKNLLKQINSDKQIYGINTGFGKLVSEMISESQSSNLQKNLIHSHAMGVGDDLPEFCVRVIMLLKVNALSRGHSGIRWAIIERLLVYFSKDIYPAIPRYGSVGASGDLAPLAHLALTLLGEGYLYRNGKKEASSECLKALSLSPIDLIAKEGLALINGTEVSTSLALNALKDLEQIFSVSLLSISVLYSAMQAHVDALDERVHMLKHHPGQLTIAACLRHLMEGSALSSTSTLLQDRYSFRCIPQILGPCLEQVQFVKHMLAREANSVTDNPLIFPDTDDIISGGNFHAQSVAMGCDNLALCLCEIGSLLERQVAAALEGNRSWPPFLCKQPGLESGLMMAHVTMTSLVSENKAKAYPRSVDSIPCSGNQEDHVSMAPNAGLRVGEMNQHLKHILAVHLITGLTAISFIRPRKLGDKLEKFIADISSVAAPYLGDRYFHEGFQPLARWVDQFSPKEYFDKDIFNS